MPSRVASFAAPLSLLLLVCGFCPTPCAAADVALPGLDGGELVPGDLESGDHVIVVWAPWSPRCRDIATSVGQLQLAWGERARVLTVVFQDSPDRIRRFLAENSLETPVFLDLEGTFSKRHGVATLPTLLVFRDGQRLFRGQLPVDAVPLVDRHLGAR